MRIKKGKVLDIGWGDFIEKIPIEPVGYSTANEISEKMGLSCATVRSRLKQKVEEGKLKTIIGRTMNGKITTFYKD